jgi:hypothetical protein
MNLFDLANDELIAIFQCVDHKTKFNLMLTCKRFENVISNYFELFGKFKLSLKKEHLKSPDQVQTLAQMRRHFVIVELCGLDLNVYTKAYYLIFQLLTRIGSRVMELEISYSQFCFDSLANLLKLMPNITKLSLSQVRITPRTMSADQIKLEKLKKNRNLQLVKDGNFREAHQA